MYLKRKQILATKFSFFDTDKFNDFKYQFYVWMVYSVKPLQ